MQETKSALLASGKRNAFWLLVRSAKTHIIIYCANAYAEQVWTSSDCSESFMWAKMLCTRKAANLSVVTRFEKTFDLECQCEGMP